MKTLNFDLNVTQRCNMRCAYCIESGNYANKDCEKILPDFCSFIDRLLSNTQDFICIGLWGGEPTLKADLLIQLIERYLKNSRVRFFLYTNGFKLSEKILNLIVRLKDVRVDGEAKLYTQISYDGMPIHDLKRKIGDSPTSQEVISTIHWAKNNKIPFSVKSTVTLDTLKYMHEAYTDIQEVLEGVHSGYFPTLDYFNDLPGDAIDTYIEEMKVSLKKIAVTMLKAKTSGKFTPEFKWFTNSKADCNAGVDLFSVDVDGKIYVCHGCFYSPVKEDHLVGNVTDDISILEKSRAKHAPVLHLNPKECKDCVATFCVRCNSVRYSVSEKNTYEERWKDYTNNINLCRLYQEAGLVARAYYQLSKR